MLLRGRFRLQVSKEPLVRWKQDAAKWQSTMQLDRRKSGGRGMNVESKEQEHNKDTNTLVGMEKWGQMRWKWGTAQGRGKEHLRRKEIWLLLRAPCININYIRRQRRSAVNKLALASRLWSICKWKWALIRKLSSWEASVPGKEILQKKSKTLPFYYYIHGNKTLRFQSQPDRC